MDANVWIALSSHERMLLLDALKAARKVGRVSGNEIDALTIKLVHSESHPSITVAYMVAKSNGLLEILFRFEFATTTASRPSFLTSMNAGNDAVCGSSRSMRTLLSAKSARIELHRHPEAAAKRPSKDDGSGHRPSRLALRASTSG